MTEGRFVLTIFGIIFAGLLIAYILNSKNYRQDTKKDIPFPIPDTVMFGGKMIPCVYTDTLHQSWGLVIGKWYNLETDDRKVLVVWYKIKETK